MNFPQLEQEELEEIERIGRLRAPNEATGVLLPRSHPYNGRTVVEMPNRSLRPLDGTVLVLEDIRTELESWLMVTPVDIVEQMAIWHTHPGGHLGPSKADMDQAKSGVAFLVVTLRDKEALPTWYTARGE